MEAAAGDVSDEHRMVQMLSLRCWRSPIGAGDHAFLQSCSLFGNLKNVLGAPTPAPQGKPIALARGQVGQYTTLCDRVTSSHTLCECGYFVLQDVTAQFVPSASSNKDRLYCVTDSTTDTFWEPAPVKAGDKAFLLFEWAKAADGSMAKEAPAPGEKQGPVCEVAVHIDCGRDKVRCSPVVKSRWDLMLVLLVRYEYIQLLRLRVHRDSWYTPCVHDIPMSNLPICVVRCVCRATRRPL